MAAKRKALSSAYLPQIIFAEDETGVTVKAGRHRAHFPAGIELSGHSDKRTARERADEHAEFLLRSYGRDRPSYRFKYGQKGADNAEKYNERRAIAYAEWLAQRDGLTIPNEYKIKTRADWSGFYSATKTRKQTRSWSGTTEHAIYCKRIRAVEWGIESQVEHYNHRKDGRRGAWAYNEVKFEVLLRIEIPNWDFEPDEPVEEIITEDLTLAPVSPAIRIPARFLATSCLVAANDPLPVAPSCAIGVA
jgi:hypothetical protein